ncbi:response regulator [Pyruvatibacter sp.]|uniref:response regulator n=1 Tax=Pyruvatibacter sp. TaxID=1981328 RepID=UPI0032650A73
MANILVVDDEPLICSMLQALLTREGHDVIIAGDGRQAIQAVETNEIDLIIVDIVMPEKDGLEAIIEIRRITPDMKIIAISGGSRIGNADFLSMARKFGACATFYKPLDNNALLKAIDRCLEI